MLENTPKSLLHGQLAPEYALSLDVRSEDADISFQAQTWLTEAKSLNNYVCNSKNAFPVSVLHTIASHSPGSKYARVFISGKSGTGKSHLLQAMIPVFSKNISKESIIYDNALHFLKQHTVLSCRSLWNTIRVLLLDDIQELPGETECQNALVALMESCPENCQLVLAYSGIPGTLNTLDARLATRLSDCLALNLLEADLDVRMRYMEHEAHRKKLAIDHQTVIYLCQHCRDIPTVRGILQKIGAFTEMYKRHLNHNDMVNILHTGKTDAIPEHRQIINRVAKSLGIRPEDILGNKRRQNFVQARQLSMYLCRTSLGLSFPELGKLFGGKDHSTVVYAVKKMQKIIDSNKEMQNLVTQLSNYAA